MISDTILNPSGVGNNITSFSEPTVKYLNTMPAIVNTWQAEDIANDNTDGYHVNPLAQISTSLKTNQTNLELICYPNRIKYSTDPDTGQTIQLSPISGLETIAAAANSGSNSANSFFAHTQRISGVVKLSDDLLPDLPHYETAVQIGKAVIYIVNKNGDSFGGEAQNNAPIIGNFTSLFIKDDLINLNSYLTSAIQTVNSSITITVSEGVDGPIYTYSSNLSPETVSSITANVISISSTMDSRRSNDEIFFQTEKRMVDNFNNVKPYGNMGESEKFLVNNYVGSNKLKTRVNS